MTGVDPVLVRGLTAIAPYLDDVVLVGGWVPYIYELLYDATAAGRSPKTRDIDIAVPRSLPVRGQSIDVLLTEADFTCEFTSTTTPPVTKYMATDGVQDVEIEFITDAIGASEQVITVQPDLTAQELRYVGLLLRSSSRSRSRTASAGIGLRPRRISTTSSSFLRPFRSGEG